MSAPASGFVEGDPRLHYVEWNPRGARTLVLLHGNSANAWWWQPFADALWDSDFRLLALDLRGHGDSEWVRPPAYRPADYADDLARFITRMDLRHAIVAGHSMGGIATLAFAAQHPELARAIVVIDVAVVSTQRRDRYLQRLRALPTVIYRDLTTAMERYRLMPNEGEIAPAVLAAVAERSLAPAPGGGYTLKFDRESFFGGDGLPVEATIRSIGIPLLLVRAEFSRIMKAEAAARAAESNPRARLLTIPGVHHHLLLERPDLLAAAIRDFAASLDQSS
jgi:pimeloyl-ACP methyl ester carboxylesterase